MKSDVVSLLEKLSKSVLGLEKAVTEHEKKWLQKLGEPELFSFANENDKKFKQAMASKLDNTIERLEKLLAEE